MQILLIDPRSNVYRIAIGDDLLDAIASFKSSVWRQGWDADGRVEREYGNWLVYEKSATDLNHLLYRGTVSSPLH